MTKIKVGVIGGGQLAWMMAQEAQKLGIDLMVQTPKQDDPAVSLAPAVLLAPISDVRATEQLAKLCDVITFENEFVDLQALKKLANQGIKFYPTLESLTPLLDKYDQRIYLKEIDLPVPQFTSLELLNNQKISFNFPLVLKAKRHGYDGKGTFIVNNQEQLDQVFANHNPDLFMVEEYVPFLKELAIMGARNQQGEIKLYPVVETQQIDQVCRRVIAPAFIDNKITEKVNQIAIKLLNNLEFIGILGIELFLTETGEIFVNEIAPRTHNSGHYTLDACPTSQFKMQLQGVTGLPLGETHLKTAGALMINLLGYEKSQSNYLYKRQQLSQLDRTYVHWYEKTESRPGRKLGHVTVLLRENNPEHILETIKNIEGIWYP